MNIKIIADSLSDIPVDIAARFDIEVIPLVIIFDDEQYLDGVELTQAQMYEKIESCGKLPKSSQVTPQRFEDVFRKYLDMGKDIIYIGSSSNATGTFRSAQLAKNNMESDKIHILDTMLLSYACGMIVVEAAKMSENGKAVGEILEMAEEMKTKVGCIFTVDTLEYLKRGGRLSATKAVIGTILNVKPLLTLEDGIVKHMKNVRGTKKAIDEIIDTVIKEAGELPKGLVISHGSNSKIFEKLKAAISKKMGLENVIETDIGAVTGIHTGPTVAAVFYLKK
ncbi:EDD domain protein, DegV family [Peptoclostridium litorale DSM 5388]|uniref:DegV domain-containing protein n=1 Tax=Peptoclostridium litorale DSM 5388 TaxID=1121324 RepID=A0A069RMY9_PEPLI|nr:DegV family protein [Peptoclostridium litorale]KDR95547.1 DegV domain-containing protein [Peptoclostridium litorale DSM 5388]SIN98021.1 EDD domain protein, DegV family [Peptoclostridium litorale DSM 5388]